MTQAKTRRNSFVEKRKKRKENGLRSSEGKGKQ